MALPANPEQLNIGQLVAALAQANAQEFLTVVELLKTSNRGVDWRLLLGAITAENAVVTADGAAAANFAQAVEGLDRGNALMRFLSVNARGQLMVVPPGPSDGQQQYHLEAAGAGALAIGGIGGIAGRRTMLLELIWSISTGAAAQPAIDLTISENNGATVLGVLTLACPANDTRSIRLTAPLAVSVVNRDLSVASPAGAANTTQRVILVGANI